MPAKACSLRRRPSLSIGMVTMPTVRMPLSLAILATTGVAGPSGGTEENPVGTVWIGLATPTGVVSKRYNFGKDRENVINRATIMAYEMLRQYLIK